MRYGLLAGFGFLVLASVGWAEPVPQTNVLPHVTVVLSSRQSHNGRHQLFFCITVLLRAKPGGDVAWMHWNVELTDVEGKSKHQRTGFEVNLLEGVLAPGRLKMVVRGEEYISAGMLPNPAPQSIFESVPNNRAKKLSRMG